MPRCNPCLIQFFIVFSLIVAHNFGSRAQNKLTLNLVLPWLLAKISAWFKQGEPDVEETLTRSAASMAESDDDDEEGRVPINLNVKKAKNLFSGPAAKPIQLSEPVRAARRWRWRRWQQLSAAGAAAPTRCRAGARARARGPVGRGPVARDGSGCGRERQG